MNWTRLDKWMTRLEYTVYVGGAFCVVFNAVRYYVHH